MDRKEQILAGLRAFVKQRPGLEFGNYGDVSSYRSELRQITKDRHQAESLIDAVAWRGITAEQIIDASQHAYSGRLTIEVCNDSRVKIDYCTGQYFPTEYRKAVCAVMAQCLWEYFRANIPVDVENKGDRLRASIKREISPPLARRWFQ